MNQIGVQTKGVVLDDVPENGFRLLKESGFNNVDFSLHQYLMNKDIYQLKRNPFFDKSVGELERFFTPHKTGAKKAGVEINQMHMPYPLYVWGAGELNEYLSKTVAVKSMAVCAFFECPNIVVHGFKLSQQLGTEAAEWARTEQFLRTLAPIAKEMKITICIENLYGSFGGRITEGPCTDPVAAAERIDRLNEDAGEEVFGFCFDTGHANLIGIDCEYFLSRLGHRLKALHIHDNDGISDLHQIPYTFSKSREDASSTDWSGFLKGLSAIRYDGVLSFETSPVLRTFPSEMMPEVLCFIAKIGHYFAGEIEHV